MVSYHRELVINLEMRISSHELLLIPCHQVQPIDSDGLG